MAESGWQCPEVINLSPVSNSSESQTVLQPLQATATTKESNPYADFLIMDRHYNKSESPFYLTLMDSASFSGYTLDFFLNKTQEMHDHEYSALIEGIPETFPPAVGKTRFSAQNKAAELALLILSRYCYTVKYLEHKEILLADILERGGTSTPSVTQPMKDNTESTCSEKESHNMLNSDCQEIVQTHIGHDSVYKETIQTHIGHDNVYKMQMPSAPQNINFQCEAHKNVLLSARTLDTRYTSSSSLVTEPLQYSSRETVFSEPMPGRMSGGSDCHRSNMQIGSDCHRSNVQINEGYSNTFGTQMTSNLDNISSDKAHLEESFGSKMLKMMGWAGGGLGKYGSGIKEPIRAAHVLGRYGVGHNKRKDSNEHPQVGKKGKGRFKIEGPANDSNANKEKFVGNREQKVNKKQVEQPVRSKKITAAARFENGICSVIDDFIGISEDRELVFSRKISNKQRKLIHEIAYTYDLSSISFGRQGSRHLVLFKEHDTEEFLQNLLRAQSSQEDSTRNYQIIPPSTDPVID